MVKEKETQKFKTKSQPQTNNHLQPLVYNLLHNYGPAFHSYTSNQWIGPGWYLGFLIPGLALYPQNFSYLYLDIFLMDHGS